MEGEGDFIIVSNLSPYFQMGVTNKDLQIKKYTRGRRIIIYPELKIIIYLMIYFQEEKEKMIWY